MKTVPVKTHGYSEPKRPMEIKAPKSILSFLEKHFNRSLLEDEREANMNDIPRPQGDVMVVSRLDIQLKEGKGPCFRAESI